MSGNLSTGQKSLFILGCPLVDRRLCVSANASHPKDVREKVYVREKVFTETKRRRSTGQLVS